MPKSRVRKRKWQAPPKKLNYSTPLIKKADGRPPGPLYTPLRVTATMEKILTAVQTDEAAIDTLIDGMTYFKEQWIKAEAAMGDKLALLQLYKVLDNRETRIHPADKALIKCTKGCSFCCHVEVGLMDTEINVIKDYVDSHHIPIDMELLTKQQEFKDGIEHMLSPHSKCVFLNEQKECSIYPVRPIACRKYFVTSDPALCDGHNNPENLEIVNISADNTMECAASAVLNTGHKLGILTKMLYECLWEQSPVEV